MPSHTWDFPGNPLDLILSKMNKKIAKDLLLSGMKPEKINEILKTFYSGSVVMQDFLDHDVPELQNWVNKILKQYDKAIACLEKLLVDNSIDDIRKIRDIPADIAYLKHNRDCFAFDLPDKMDLSAASIHQMVSFQGRALYEYIKNFRTSLPDQAIYNFIAELFRNLYGNTFFHYKIKNLTGEILKKNFIDNAYNKLSQKYNNKLEETIRQVLSH